jgi:hypothetical protein
MKHLLVVLVAHILVLAHPCAVSAAGPFDGKWNGSATSGVGRCKPAVVMVTVQGRDVTGQARFELDATNINGTVREDGTFGATIGWQPLTGKFNEDRFEGTFKSDGCIWKLILQRAN